MRLIGRIYFDRAQKYKKNIDLGTFLYILYIKVFACLDPCQIKRAIMVHILLKGSSVYIAHVWSELGNLIC